MKRKAFIKRNLRSSVSSSYLKFLAASVFNMGLILPWLISASLLVNENASANPSHPGVAPHPKGCIDDEIYISSQDWWLTTPGEVGEDGLPGEDFGHLHTELCFPHATTITGEMSLEVTSIMHHNPGDFNKVVIQLWQSGLNDMTPESDTTEFPVACGEGSAIACKVFNPPRTLDTCEASGGTLVDEATCKWVDGLSFDTSYFPNDGWQQFRVRGKVEQPDGTSMRTSTGLHAYISNGNTVDHVYENPELLEGRGWYTDANYAVSNVKDLTAGPVSGFWAPWVEMKQGSDGIPITSHRVALDANIHADDLGIELKDGPGPYEGRVLIDTTTLTNGWHKLFLRASQFEPISGSTNSSVFVALFEVLNENPPTCDLIYTDPAIADAYVRGGGYADDNFGADDDLVVKSASDEKYTRRSFLRFDLSGYQASSIESAAFKGYVHSHQSPGVSVPLSLYAVNEDTWGESSITWNSQPVSGSLLGTVHVSDVGPVEFDISAHVTAELTGDDTLSLVLVDDSGTNQMLKLRSRSDEYDTPSIEIVPASSECTPPPTGGADTTPPVITLIGDSTVNLILGSAYTDAGATALDNIDGDITENIVKTGVVDVDTVGSYTLKYNVSDAAGNASAEVTRTVVVSADLTAPDITLTGDPVVNVILGSEYIDAGATAIDNVDGDITSNIVITGSVDVNTAGSYILLYNVSDAAGNAAAEVTRTVVVSEDETAPVITLTGDPVVTIITGSTYIDDGATAVDDVDGDITANIVTTGSVDVNTAGSYTIRYNVTDAAGNAAAEVVRTVNVTNILMTTMMETRVSTGPDDAEERESGRVYVDSSDLELVHDGSKGDQTVGLRFNDVQLPQGAVITHAHISFVADESDSEVTSLTIRAEATDSSQPILEQDNNLSNRSTTSASVTWQPDSWSTGNRKNSPDIASVIQEVTSRTAWSSGNALTVIIEGTGKRVAESYEGRAYDAALLHVEYVLQAPVISLVGEAVVFVNLGTAYIDAGATAYDNVDGDVTANVVTDNPVDINTAAAYTITYNVTDTSGNAATEVTRKVVVIDPSQNASVFEARIATGADDAEEKEGGNGNVSTGSTDLELVADGSRGNQTVALRFTNVQVPQDAAIANAYIRFVADESDSEATSLIIQAEAVDSSASLSTKTHNLSSRATTSASVSWAPGAWSRGDQDDTPNIASVVQEVVSREAWTSGNALTILVNGMGKRVAESYNGSPEDAALLHIEYY